MTTEFIQFCSLASFEVAFNHPKIFVGVGSKQKQIEIMCF